MSTNIQKTIRAELQKLVGYPLTRTTRASTMECLKFGEYSVVDRRGDLYNIGKIGLHLQCAWRITRGRETVVGSSDLFAAELEQPEDFDWEQFGNYRDRALEKIIESKPTVQAVEADEWGGFQMKVGEYHVSVFPESGKRDEYTEYWRLLFNAEAPPRQVVVSPTGVWDSKKDSE